MINEFDIKIGKFTVKGVAETNDNSNPVIIFSPGFGVKLYGYKDMFIEIGNIFKDKYNLIFFDYFQIDDQGRSIVPSLRDQAQILDAVLKYAKENLSTDITLIGHSQGGAVISLLPEASQRTIKRVILISSPLHPAFKRWYEYFHDRPGVIIDENGISRIPRSDGSITYVTKEFIDDLKTLSFEPKYLALTSNTKVTYIKAEGDEIVDDSIETIRKFPLLQVFILPGDHNFMGKDRLKLIETVRGVLKK